MGDHRHGGRGRATVSLLGGVLGDYGCPSHRGWGFRGGGGRK
jgi:hypothetical protein